MTEQQFTYLSSLGLVLWGKRPASLPENPVPIPRSAASMASRTGPLIGINKKAGSLTEEKQPQPGRLDTAAAKEQSNEDEDLTRAKKPQPNRPDIAATEEPSNRDEDLTREKNPQPSRLDTAATEEPGKKDESLTKEKNPQSGRPDKAATREPSNGAEPAEPKAGPAPLASQDAFSFRYEALVVPPAIVLYEITGELELPSQQKALLDSMLSRCGLTGSARTRSLPWPPPYSLGEESDYAEQAYQGFLTSLVENNHCEWLILMGESKLTAALPTTQIIKLDSLRLLVQEPKRRKQAWDQLAPLRQN